MESAGPPSAMSAPVAAGAIRALPLATHPDTTLAAVSSSGERTTQGNRVACAGRGTAIVRYARGARQKTTAVGAWTAIASAMAAVAAACSR